MKKTLWFEAIVIENNKAWVFALDINALFEIDMSNYQVRYLGSVPGEPLDRGSLYFGMTKCRNFLILAPFGAKSVAVYDLEDNAFVCVPKPHPNDNFFIIENHGENVFFVGNTIAKICVLNMCDKTIKTLYSVQELRQSNIISNRFFSRKTRTIVGDYLYFGLCNENSIAKLNMKDYSFNRIPIEGAINGIRFVCHMADDVFFVNEWEKAEVIIWSESQGTIGKYKCEIPGFERFKVGEMYYYKELVWLFPTVGPDVLLLNIKNGKWEVCKELSKYGVKGYEIEQTGNKQSFPVALQKEDGFFVLAGNTRTLLDYSVEKKKVKTIRLEYDGTEVCREFIVAHKEPIFENGFFTLADFFDVVSEGKGV